MSIIHWNIRSLNANYTAGLAVLLTSINPSVVCLQETKLPADYSNIAGTTIAGYKAFHQIYSGGDIACGGTSIYIKNNILHRHIPLITPLQATACRVTLKRPITVCSLYLPPDSNLHINDLHNLVKPETLLNCRF